MAVKRKFPIKVATVYCNGGCNNNSCTYGCLGCGACEGACKFDSIHVTADGVAKVNEDTCLGCGACMRACPQGIIRIRPMGNSFAPLCSNKDKGPTVKDVCSNSCIACGACVRKCPADAISVETDVAVIDDSLCLSCGACAMACPRGVIHDQRGIITD